VLVEHFDSNAAAWFPESVIGVRKAADVMIAAGQLLPEPVYYVLARAKRRLGGHVLTLDDAAAATRLSKAEILARALAGTMPGARRSGNRWVIDRDPLIAAGLIAFEDPHQLAHNAALMGWIAAAPAALAR
jgi:hypothetical protein